MKKVGMLTTFLGYLESYSLCQVARTQLKMLKENGYECRFLFRGGDDSEWRKFTNDIRITPDCIVDNDGNSSSMEERSKKKFPELVKDMLDCFEKELAGLDVVITQDLIFQSSNNIQDAAAALYAEAHPEVRWLHWVHSATSPRDLNKTKSMQYKNSFVCYPNAYDVPRVARNFGYEEPDVKVVPHPIDYEEFFDWHPLTTKLVQEKNLLSADVIGIYPLRLDRGKQPDISLRIFNQLKKRCGLSIRFVIVDFQSTGGDKVTFREEMKDLVTKMGWNSDELTFMSEFDPSCHMQTPKKVVRDLTLLSDVYIHPSKSETYSLTTQEARACRNMLVLNFDYPPMAGIYLEGPIYKKFSSCVDMLTGNDGSTETKYTGRDGIDGYMADVASSIAYHLENQAVLKMSRETRQNKNTQVVFKRCIEPLFYAG